MENTKKRDEISSDYKWDLTTMYETDALYEKEVTNLEQQIQKFKTHDGKVLSSAESLLSTFDDYYAIDEVIEKIYVYAYCKFTTDVSDKLNQKIFAMANNVLENFSNEKAFFLPELLKCDYDLIEKFYHQNNDLKKYETILKRIFRFKEHSLNKSDEKLFSSFASIESNFEESSTYLRNQVMKFGNIIDESGNEIELTNQNYSEFMKNKNRDIRKQAYYLYKKEYEQYNNPLALNYIGHIKFSTLDAKSRNYKDSLEQDLDSLHLPMKVINSLISVTNKHLDIYQRYFKIYKEILNVDQLMPYDLSAPIVLEETNYSYEEAKKLILDSVKIYGEEYYDVAKSVFDNHWVDVFSNENKQTGWYKNGSYTTNVVIFANYFSKYIDVSSLAHELGHAVNGTLAARNNPYYLYEESLFLAEVASLTNEMVLGKQLLKKVSNKNQKLEILKELISIFSSNYFSSVSGFEFEIEAHKLVENNCSVTPEILNNLWLEINNKYKGNVVNDLNQYGWSLIPHFFIDFYYYKYATGVTIAMYLSDKILDGTEQDRENYIKFLKLGDSLDAIDALKIAGIDITDENVFEQAVKSYNKLLDELEETIKN